MQIFRLIIVVLSIPLVTACNSETSKSGSVESFAISDVKILEGPFLDARQTSMNYILQLDMDRLLAPFLKDAGIKPLQENYGNWENTGLDGHIGGHYLSALSLMYASTGDEEFIERLDYMLMWLERCQNKNGNGYMGGIPGGKALWKEIAAGDIRAHAFSLNDKWVPLYNIHKLYAGLSDAWMHAHSELALNMLIDLTDWMIGVTGGLSDEQIQEMLKSEHGGLNEVFSDLYTYTGDARYLELAERFSQRAILDPLLDHKNELTGMHANTQIPKIIGFKKIADANDNKGWSDAAEYFWDIVHDHWTVAIGGNSVREHFHPVDDFSDMVKSVQGPETCNTYNMLKLTKLLFQSDPQSKYMDYYERAMYNHILSSQHPGEGGYVYMTPMRPQHYRVYSSPHQSFWCCVGSGMENHAKYGEMIYSKAPGCLYVNMFIPSRLSWDEEGVEVVQESGFPYIEESSLKLDMDRPRHFSLLIRQPGWIEDDGMQISINGDKQEIEADSTGYVSLRRKWKAGDEILVRLNAKTYAEYLPDHSAWVSFLHGPIVLAAVTDTLNLTGIFADDSRMGHIASGPRIPVESAPTLVLDKEQDLGSVIEEMEGAPLRFRLTQVTNVERGEMILKPFFELHDARYMIYWPVK